jgi:hypothetical protein
MLRTLVGTLSFLLVWSFTSAQTNDTAGKVIEHDPHLNDFQVIEFRRYIVKEGERKHFAQYFDAYFPEAFQQLGTIVVGSFFERKNQSGFTWMRALHRIDDRAVASAAFHYGSVWNEHRKTMADLFVDTDNVMLLCPLSLERGVAILPAVDPVKEPAGAQGIIVAQVFAVKANSVTIFAKAAETTFARYLAAGAREAGILVTLDVKNNFPQLPFRTDGPFLVWVGVLKDNQALDANFAPVVEQSLAPLVATGLLRGVPELIILDPTPRSRLRWLESSESTLQTGAQKQ